MGKLGVMNATPSPRRTAIESPDPDVRQLCIALTLDRQRAGILPSMGACTPEQARECIDVMLEMAIEHAHYIGPFHTDV